MSADRVDCLHRVLMQACVDRNYFITGDGRIGEAEAAALIGISGGTLKNKRSEGSGPIAYRRGINGGKVSYQLHDIAQWIEEGRENY